MCVDRECCVVSERESYLTMVVVVCVYGVVRCTMCGKTTCHIYSYSYIYIHMMHIVNLGTQRDAEFPIVCNYGNICSQKVML